MYNEQKKVVCIDDNRLVLEVLQCYLKFRGYTVFPFSDGRSALELIANDSIDAVVVDYQMPGMNGSEVTAEIRSINTDVPIVMFSGVNEIPQNALMLIDAFFQKGDPDCFSSIVDYLDSLFQGGAFRREVHRSNKKAQPRNAAA